MLTGNNIIRAQEAADKLRFAFKQSFGEIPANFTVGVDVANGKYTVVATVAIAKYLRALPRDVDGYKVDAGIIGEESSNLNHD